LVRARPESSRFPQQSLQELPPQQVALSPPPGMFLWSLRKC